MSNRAVTLGLLILARVAESTNEQPVGRNYPHLVTLCRIFTTAKNPPLPKLPSGLSDDTQNRLSGIRVALADDEWFKELTEKEEKEKISQAASLKFKEFLNEWDSWKKGKTWLDTQENITKLDGASPTTIQARRQFEQVQASIREIYERVKKFNSDDRRKEIVEALNTAAAGTAEVADWAKIEPHGLLKGTARNTYCGTGGSPGTKAGDTLTTDMLCLCASMNAAAGKKNLCGPDIGGKADSCSAGDGDKCWVSSTMAPTATLLKTITDACNETQTPPAQDSRQIGELIATFYQQAGNGIVCHKGSNQKEAVNNALGFVGKADAGDCGGHGSVDCDGDGATNGSKGACVRYKAKLADLSWVTKVNEARTKIKKLETDAEHLKTDIAHARMLAHRAVEIYEGAKIASELEKNAPERSTQEQSGTKDSNSPTTKTAAQEPNDVGMVSVIRIILLWTLFI